MRSRRRLQTLVLCGATLLLAILGRAAELPPASPESSRSTFTTEQLVTRVRPSLVTLSTRGRDGANESVGTGFVIDASGLIATSLHVVGESRPISARLASGEELEVISIHAFDRHADLAILRVAATNLPVLPLGDSSLLAVGAEVVAFGNPLGLENSVVAGVLSGRRSFEEIEMLQLAIPIEPGNSGGPLLDRAGRVNGIVNAKSLLTRNLGFATPINLLKPLLERPNPVPLARWVRTGALDSTRWESHLGANWRQRAGRILVEGVGSGFGGRSFVVQRAEAPTPPYEVTVTVRLQDESGAAGLIFGGDNQGRHYGFYPTGGQLRLTAFEGPEVFSWRILGTVPSPAYHSGEWNVLRVRQDSGRIQCWVNGSEVFSVSESALSGRRVGLAKFRNTQAEFRDFACAKSLESGATLAENLVNALGGTAPPLTPLNPEQLATLRTQLPAARAFLATRARDLEREATRLRELAVQLHRDQVREDLVAELHQPEDKIDLARAALLVARLDTPDLDLTAYRQQLRDLGEELRGRLTAPLSGAERVELLRKFLFEENGFHGSRHDYYNRANSYLNEVLDDREGLPITLSFVFLSVAEQAGISDLHGVPLPGHFLVKYAPPGTDERLIDVFDGGRYLTHSEADELGSSAARLPVRSEFIRPATKREMIVRLLGNLQSFTERDENPAASLPYADLLVAVAGDSRSEAAQRIDRARLRSRTGDLAGARADLQWIVETEPPGFVLEQLNEMIERLDAASR